MRIILLYQNYFLMKLNLLLTILLSLFLVNLSFAQDGDMLITLKGKVVEAKNQRNSISYVVVSVSESDIGTITNNNGEFQLKIPKKMKGASVVFSHVGLENQSFSVEEALNMKSFVVRMKKETVQLSEVDVITGDPEEIIERVKENIAANYGTIPNVMESFYRESILKNKRYVSISEAVIDIHKEGYLTSKTDRVWLYKGRKNTKTGKRDTLLFNLQGGPITPIKMDIVKYADIVLYEENKFSYNIILDGAVSIDGRTNFVLRFTPKESVEYPLYQGVLYVDVKTYAISRVEFNLSPENLKVSTSMFIRKKPRGARIETAKASYMINYKLGNNGMWHLSYAIAEVSFRVKWDRKLLDSYYHANVEMVVTDMHNDKVLVHEKRERLKENIVLTEKLSEFSDEGFWGEHNTIEPEKSINQAIKKIGREVR
jgi:outer membrane lipoprotein-sorting protein